MQLEPNLIEFVLITDKLMTLSVNCTKQLDLHSWKKICRYLQLAFYFCS